MKIIYGNLTFYDAEDVANFIAGQRSDYEFGNWVKEEIEEMLTAASTTGNSWDDIFTDKELFSMVFSDDARKEKARKAFENAVKKELEPDLFTLFLISPDEYIKDGYVSLGGFDFIVQPDDEDGSDSMEGAEIL